MSTYNLKKTATDGQILLSGMPLDETAPRAGLNSRSGAVKTTTSAAFMAARPPIKSGPRPGPTPAVIDPNQDSFAFAAEFTNEPANEIPLPPIPVIENETPPSASELQYDALRPSPDAVAPAPDDAQPGDQTPDGNHSESELGTTIETTLYAERPVPTSDPIFGYFMNFRGASKRDPIPLNVMERIPLNIDDATAAVGAVEWVHHFIAIDDHDRLGRLQMLIAEIGPFAPLVRTAERTFLNGALALHLIVRDGYYRDLCTSSGLPLFKTPGAFITAFLKFHDIGNSATRVSRLMAGAKLWLLIVEAQLPPAPTLSRIESLISLPTNVAITAYAELAAAAGNRVPSLAAIEAKADDLKGKTKPARKKTALTTAKTKQIAVVATEARRLLVFIAEPTCDREKFVAEFREMVAKLEALAPTPQPKTKLPARLSSAAPAKPCPVTLALAGKDLVVKLHPSDAALATAIHVRALGKRWSKSGNQEWSMELPPGPSARAAKVAQIKEHLTRVLASFDYQAPLQPANS